MERMRIQPSMERLKRMLLSMPSFGLLPGLPGLSLGRGDHPGGSLRWSGMNSSN